MVNSLEIETKKTSPFEAFREKVINLLSVPQDDEPANFQQILLEASYNYTDVKVRQKLEDAIYYGISFLLDKIIHPDQRIDSNGSKILAQKIDYLLTKSQSIWQDYFQEYAQIVAKITLDEDYEEANNYPSVINFWRQILDIIPNLKNIHEQNRRSYYGNYKSLAIIFSKTQQKDLSEFLYRMSGNIGRDIPPEIRNSLSPDIRSRLFGVPNQTMLGQVYFTQSIHHHNNTGDGGGKAIFGFLFFLAGTLIFFNFIKH
ncbi:MAG: hypothetical protein ACKPE3_29480, partial [Sphaerospermopsis kisseleviana]